MMIRPSTLFDDTRPGAKQYSSSVSSTASSLHPSSTASENVPSLDRSFSTMSTRTVDTDESLASSMAEFGTRPPARTLQCSFAFLGCREEFGDVQDWKTHSSSHFRAQRPPSSSQCPFCSARWTDGAWAARLEHVATHHRDERLGVGYRADHDLFRHLLGCKVVSYAQYQELERRHWCDGSGAVYIETYNPRCERREGAPGGWTSYRVGG